MARTTDLHSGDTACHRLLRFGWLLPVLVAFGVYSAAFDNYFAFDDFIWLNRARTFRSDWLQMFRPDVTYFDPLVHLMFVLDRAVGGLDPRWYHFVDLSLHAGNALLVWRLARLLGGDRRAALYGAVLFAGSFAVADAVLWPSSRVDLLSTLFSLASLIQFLHYLRGGQKRRLLLSFLAFLLALGAKGTPVVLPALLLWLLLQEKKPLASARCLIPFGAAVALFFLLLKLNMHNSSLPLDRYHFNMDNAILAFGDLFVPEGFLLQHGVAVIASLLFALASFAGLAAAPLEPLLGLRRTGYLLMVLGIIPVLVLTQFKLVGDISQVDLLLVSPSHRIYLAAAGAALLVGGTLRSLEIMLQQRAPRLVPLALAVLLLAVVGADLYQVRQRAALWQPVGERFRLAFQGLLRYRGDIPEGSQLGLIRFPSARGFQTPMALLALDLNNVSILKRVVIGVDDPNLLPDPANTFLFALGSDGLVYDKTPMYRQQLLLNRLALLAPQRAERLKDCAAVARRLALEIRE